jgi:hypothetical protein
MTADAAPGGTCGRVARGRALAPGAARTGIVLTAALVQARGAWTVLPQKANPHPRTWLVIFAALLGVGAIVYGSSTCRLGFFRE